MCGLHVYPCKSCDANKALGRQHWCKKASDQKKVQKMTRKMTTAKCKKGVSFSNAGSEIAVNRR